MDQARCERVREIIESLREELEAFDFSPQQRLEILNQIDELEAGLACEAPDERAIEGQVFSLKDTVESAVEPDTETRLMELMRRVAALFGV